MTFASAGGVGALAREDTTVAVRSPRAVKSSDEQPEPSPTQRALEGLRRAGARGGDLELRETLGEGGMGVVRSARQVCLGREVAVKSVRPDVSPEASSLALLREAWVTGTLEHPNVVPVYDVHLDDEDRPRIVLKKIAGSSWSELLLDDAEVRRRFAVQDALEWHLRTWMQVSSAVAFAHSRGILHRDIKPENVMIGRFGEVYLLDWGIALSFAGDPRLPSAADRHDVAGTPAYMAAEMLRCEPGSITPQTDVYLLGATLYEVVTGRPPHEHDAHREVLASIMRGTPDLPGSIPPELARILGRALALDPSLRYESVALFRSAVAAFLEHRGSASLAADAEARAERLRSEITRPTIAEVEARRIKLYRLFAEARFGFTEAIRRWPGNDAAREGLQRAVATMVELELDEGDVRAAAVLLEESGTTDRELARRVSKARRAVEEADRRRAALEADHDPAVGRRSRVLLGGLLGAVWTAFPFSVWLAEQLGGWRRAHRDAIVSTVLVTLLAMALAWRERVALARTAINRRLIAFLAIFLMAQLSIYVASWAWGIPLARAVALKLLLASVVTACAGTSIDRRLGWPVAAFFGAFVVSGFFPAHVMLGESFASFVLGLVLFVVWGRPAAPRSQSGASSARS